MNKRFVIIGTSGSGKTTLAKQIATQLSIKHVEADALFHLENWTQNPNFLGDLTAALSCDAWVIDGNYGSKGMRDVAWVQTDTIVWLDYPKWLCLWRITRRSLPRAIMKTPLWNGNHETLRKLFLSKESMILWVWNTHGRRAIQYSQLMESDQYAHLEWVRLRSPKAAEIWLNSLL